MVRRALDVGEKAALEAKQKEEWAQLIAAINEGHHAFESGLVAAVQGAVRSGTALAKAKSRMDSYKWAKWLRANSGVSARRALAYIKLASAFPSLATNVPKVSDAAARDLVALLVEGGMFGERAKLEEAPKLGAPK